MMKKKDNNLPKNPVGRPTKYTVEVIEELADKLIEYFKDEEHYWLGSFASDNGMWRARLDEFAKENEYFSYALKQAKEIQESRIVRGAMLGKYNCSMAIFALKNVSGYRDMPPEKEEENLRGQELEFTGIPKNGIGKEAYKRFFN